MAIDWVKVLVIPSIEVAFIGGILIFIGYWVSRAVSNAWTKQTRFFFKFKIFRKPYPEDELKWIMSCIDNGIGWYEAKKLLYIKMVDMDRTNEILYIYDEVIKSLNKENLKGGKNDRIIKRSDRTTESTEELPTF